MSFHKTVQRIELNYLIPTTYTGWVDGKYGDGIKNTVKKFQKDNGITITSTITLEFYEKLGVIEFE